MSRSSSYRFPVTVTQLPTVRCQICGSTFACRPGQAAGAVLTEHYHRVHPDVLAAAAREQADASG
jgi:hypothetical protein